MSEETMKITEYTDYGDTVQHTAALRGSVCFPTMITDLTAVAKKAEKQLPTYMNHLLLPSKIFAISPPCVPPLLNTCVPSSPPTTSAKSNQAIRPLRT